MAKVQLSITINEDIVKRIRERIDSKRYASTSHFFEYAATQIMAKGG